MTERLPTHLWLIRHGESAGNVARDRAMASRSEIIDLTDRDIDVNLSELGTRQSAAVGNWFSQLACNERPEVILTSPYARARKTAEIIACQANISHEVILDERLREKEFGQLDRLTKLGIEARFPQEAKSRAAVGKFYYRPPSGESWCDVILRLRSAFDTICLRYAGKRVLIVSHQVVVLCFRYLLENFDERELLAIDSEGDVANCSITEYTFQATDSALKPKLIRYNFVAPLQATGTPVTAEPDKPLPK